MKYRLRRVRPLVERLWARVNKGGPVHPTLGTACWLWTGPTIPRGYGYLSRGRRGEGRVYVHRLSYELQNGPIPDGFVVAHHCDNPPCMRPDHLFAATQQENLNDMHRKGRDRWHRKTERRESAA